jgi:hypothetical protein
MVTPRVPLRHCAFPYEEIHMQTRDWRRDLVATLFVMVSILAPAVAFAQASITGVVRDASGAVLPE